MVESNEYLIIDQHSRAQMIADGELIDVSNAAKALKYRIPVAVTQAVWIGSIEPFDGQEAFSVQRRGALWKILTKLARDIMFSSDEDEELFFTVPLTFHEGKVLSASLKATLGRGDKGEPILTINGA